MDIAVTNPFVVGRYISDKYFCDREQETDFLIKQIENGRNKDLITQTDGVYRAYDYFFADWLTTEY